MAVTWGLILSGRSIFRHRDQEWTTASQYHNDLAWKRVLQKVLRYLHRNHQSLLRALLRWGSFSFQPPLLPCLHPVKDTRTDKRMYATQTKSGATNSIKNREHTARTTFLVCLSSSAFFFLLSSSIFACTARKVLGSRAYTTASSLAIATFYSVAGAILVDHDVHFRIFKCCDVS